MSFEQISNIQDIERIAEFNNHYIEDYTGYWDFYLPSMVTNVNITINFPPNITDISEVYHMNENMLFVFQEVFKVYHAIPNERKANAYKDLLKILDITNLNIENIQSFIAKYGIINKNQLEPVTYKFLQN